MSAERPTVSAELVAAMIQSTPDRVRRRLDREPAAAAGWDWQRKDAGWAVETGGETVSLSAEHIAAVEQVRCTCLLSPQCFHVLACVMRLEVTVVETAKEATDVLEPKSSEGEDLVEVDEKQRRAAGELVDSVSQLLRVGIANAGVVVQSGLLRAVHQCRAEGLHRLAAVGLRAIAGTRELRSRAVTSDPPQLADDIADVLETSRYVLGGRAVVSFWIGTARRKQSPVHPRRLHGLFAEPILTRSGYAGAAVYLLGEDDRIYTVSDVRPGEAQHARDGYLGGIEFGPMIQPAKQLARGQYLGTDLTASTDGRLGRGKGVKIVDQGLSTWAAEPVQRRFRRPLLEQWNAIYAAAALPADTLPAGWDFVFLDGAVEGAVGAELSFRATGHDESIRLAIANESSPLLFRENLRMLSHAPGLRIQVIARLNLADPLVASALAVAPSDVENAEATALDVPKSLGGRVCLGFDEILNKHLVRASAKPVLVGQLPAHAEQSPLDSLRRRWIASMLSGFASQRPTRTNTLVNEASILRTMGFATGSALLDSLSRSDADKMLPDVDAFLAVAVYLRICGHELARSRATLGVHR